MAAMWPLPAKPSAMRSTSLPTRPLTPPDTEPDCFPDTHERKSTPPLDRDGGSLQSSPSDSEPAEARYRPKLGTGATEPVYARGTFESSHDDSAPEYPSASASRASSHYNILEAKDALAQEKHTYIADPITPIKTPWSSGLLPDNGIPQYPYTPESVRTTKSHAVRSFSPLPSMPWSTQDSCSSPMQDALLSCASHLEGLILSREPTDEQIEYLVEKFEEMARFLSAPDSQSKQTDDHLFSELESPPDATVLGIVSEEATNHHVDADDLALSQGYILEVGMYIESVKRHIKDLTMRMDEVKQLNSIQLDIIGDLRRDLKNRTIQLRKEKGESAQKRGIIKNVHVPPQRKGFWSAITEALDDVGDMLYEW